MGHAGPLNQGEDFGFLLSWVPVENIEQGKNIIRHMSSYDFSGCYMKNRLTGCNRAGTTVRRR